jgi:hypothetical protein
MAKNIWEIVIDAFQEAEGGNTIPKNDDTTVPSLNEYIRWSNQAKDIITNETNCLEQNLTLSSVARQQKYSLPDKFIRSQWVDWVQATSAIYHLAPIPIQDWRDMQATNFNTAIPQFYVLYNRELWLYPETTSSASTTAINDATNISATDTTITVDSLSGFPSRGLVIIDDEVIEYTNTNSTNVTLLNCVRGREGTTAASHLDDATVTERDIHVYSNVRHLIRDMNIYNTGTVAITSGAAAVTGTTTLWGDSPNAYKGWKMGFGENPTKWYEISSVDSDTSITLTSNLEEATISGGSYVIASPIEIPDEYAELFRLYFMWKTKLRLEEFAQAREYKGELDRKLNKTTNQFIDETSQAYATMRDTRVYDK